jgi:hypothetical protein
MNVKIDIDISPDEVRKLFGLPDVEAFHRQLMDDIRARIADGAEGYDPLKLFQPYLSGTLAPWDMYRKMMSAAAEGASSEAAKKK